MQNCHMPNTNRAGLSLIDQDGIPWRNGKTDDLSDYTNNTAKKNICIHVDMHYEFSSPANPQRQVLWKVLRNRFRMEIRT